MKDPLKQTEGYLVLCVHGKSEKDCKQKKKEVLLRHIALPGCFWFHDSLQEYVALNINCDRSVVWRKKKVSKPMVFI